MLLLWLMCRFPLLLMALVLLLLRLLRSGLLRTGIVMLLRSGVWLGRVRLTSELILDWVCLMVLLLRLLVCRRGLFVMLLLWWRRSVVVRLAGWLLRRLVLRLLEIILGVSMIRLLVRAHLLRMLLGLLLRLTRELRWLGWP